MAALRLGGVDGEDLMRRKNDIILQAISIQYFKDMLREMIRNEFNTMNDELQRVLGEDDLVSTGSACRILGVCSKALKVWADRVTLLFSIT
jgi:hypothetical protein